MEVEAEIITDIKLNQTLSFGTNANFDSNSPVIENDNPLNVQIEESGQPQILNNFESLATTGINQNTILINSNNTQVSCDYCNGRFHSDTITEHIEECDLRNIWCFNCGERVPIDIFDAHSTECEAQNHDNRSNRRNNIANMYLPEGQLTYEHLLRLDDNIEKKGMTPEEVKKFKVCLYVKSLDGKKFCNICMSDYVTGEYSRELSCRHSFHQNCIDMWLKTNITCPTCKKFLR